MNTLTETTAFGIELAALVRAVPQWDVERRAEVQAATNKADRARKKRLAACEERRRVQRAKIVAALIEFGKSDTARVGSLTGSGRTTALKRLIALENAGRVVRSGSSDHFYWDIPKKEAK